MKEDSNNISNIQLNEKEQKSDRLNETPLLYIDINLEGDKSERLVVFKGDQPKDLAYKFCLEHELDEETQLRLED